MNMKRDIQSLSTFKHEASRLIAQMRKTREPMILTVNGRAEVVVRDVESYQELLAFKDRMEAIARIRRGLEEMKRGEGQPFDEFEKEFREKHNILPDEEQ